MKQIKRSIVNAIKKESKEKKSGRLASIDNDAQVGAKTFSLKLR